MNLRFSRTSLNLIIFTCIILIGLASIDKNRSADNLDSDNSDIIRDIELIQLEPLNHQSWTSQEGIQVNWQSRLDTEFLIRVRGSRPDQSDPININHISWQGNYWQWDLNLGSNFELGVAKLDKLIIDFPESLKNQPATIILQGPWGLDIARLTSARVISSLQLKPLETISPNTESDTESNTKLCPWQPVTAQLWLQDQMSNSHLSQADSKNKHWIVKDWPHLVPQDAQSLYIWKQTFVKQWQLKWQNPTTQFDILADLAYYRLPENYLLQGYWGINALSIQQLEKYLAQCQASHRSI